MIVRFVQSLNFLMPVVGNLLVIAVTDLLVPTVDYLLVMAVADLLVPAVDDLLVMARRPTKEDRHRGRKLTRVVATRKRVAGGMRHSLDTGKLFIERRSRVRANMLD